MKKRDDLCIIDVALDKEGTVFLNLAYKLGGREDKACAVGTRKIPERKQLNFSYLYMKQKISLACCQFFVTSVTSYLPSVYKILTLETRRGRCKKFYMINRMGWEPQFD